MFDGLRRAADRGVRVRLLLDDNNTKGLDPTLAALDAHPNVEVRLFNPFMQRSRRAFGFITDFERLNRRMHNKSLTADGAATIVGGRNIGDEYFAAGDGVGFIDLDVIAVGPVVDQVAQSFDEYWRSGSAYPVERLLSPARPADLAAFAALGDEVKRLPQAQRYLVKVGDTRVMRDLEAQALPFEWAAARLVVDDPAKGLGKAARDDLLLYRLDGAFGGAAKTEFAIVSPYFVPGRAGTNALVRIADGGVKVKILTNALESTDVAAVHSGYAKRRHALLKAGIELYELRRAARAAPPDAIGSSGAGDQPGSGESSSRGNVGEFTGSGSTASADASLHAKTFAVDRERIFVGSFNFDPRSAIHNTELGLVIDSPLLAGTLSRAFEKEIPEASYQVQFDASGKLEWLERRPDGQLIRYKNEPGASFGRRFAVGFFSLLPIEGLL
jgi:putative cardiolipin synthase